MKEEITLNNSTLKSNAKAYWQVLTTLFLYFSAIFTFKIEYDGRSSFWALSLLMCLMALLLVRMFVLYHDCGHKSLFETVRLNNIWGHILGHLTFSPPKSWSFYHGKHHKSFGLKSAKNIGDYPTKTYREYIKASPVERNFYKFARNPFFFLYIGVVEFGLHIRMNIFKNNENGRDVKINTAFIIVYSLMLAYFVTPVVLLHIYFTATIGVLLFYFQHQHSGAKKANFKSKEEWDFRESAFYGSSYLKMPSVLEYFMADINYHHIHHLDASVPNYNLKIVHKENNLDNDSRVTTFSKPSDYIKSLNSFVFDDEAGKWLSIVECYKRMKSEKSS